jgi:CRP/FNR family transcriptional regulator, nitrogen oxide reductase regulator
MKEGQPPPLPAGDPGRGAHLLAHCPLFESMHPKDLEDLGRFAQQRAVKRGDFFYLEGDSPDHVYVLARGRVRLVRTGPQGREVIVGFIEPAEPFGYVAVWAGTAHHVSAQAAQDCRALAWGVPTIARLMTQHPGIALSGLRLMAERVEGSWDRLQDLATGHVEWRVARTLLRLAHLTRRTLDAGSAITLQVREQDLAELVGSTAFTVSRILSEWRRAGFVDARREHILIRAPGRLREIAEDATTRPD